MPVRPLANVRRALTRPPRAARLAVAVLGISALAHLVVLFGGAGLAAAIAALTITAFLPGLLLIEALLGGAAGSLPRGERLLYSLGAGYAVLTLGMLLLSYLPGGLSSAPVLLGFDALTLGLLAAAWWQQRGSASQPAAGTGSGPAGRDWRWLLLGLLALLVIGGFLRLTNLGYAEFHGDEARAALRAAAVIQGREEVLMLHKKGPGEILVPTALLALAGGLPEQVARLPFAIAGLASLFAVYLLGARMRGAAAGWVAAFLLVFDGYLVAFSRFVQYQSVVLLLTTLAVLMVYRVYRDPRAAARLLTLAALLQATALLYHYDAAVALLPSACLLVAMAVRRVMLWNRLLRAAAPGAAVGVLCLAIFYLPYALHPHFRATAFYLLGQRVDAGGFPYDNIRDVFLRTTVYSSSYYVLVLIGLLLLAYYRACRRGWNPAVAVVAGGLFVLTALTMAVRPEWLIWRGVHVTFLPLLALLAVVWIAPRLGVELRTLWLWFGLTLLVSLFFVAQPMTHVYVFFVPWALLAGDAVATAWHSLQHRAGLTTARTAAVIGAGAAALVFGGYIYWYFVHTDTEVLLNWESAHPSFYWTPYARPESISLYGFPFANGWKVVGALYDQGVLAGDYETNQWFDWVPDWYTRGQHRCASTATWYFAIDNPEPYSERSADIHGRLEAAGYRKWGVVTVGDTPHMSLYRRTKDDPDPASPLQVFRLEDYAAGFDARADAQLALDYPTIEPAVVHPRHANFGGQVRLEGYDLAYTEPLHAGDRVRLTLFWRGQQAHLPPYKVFNQAVDEGGRMAAQKDSYSRCDRLPTPEWPPGELVADTFDIQISDDAPAGVYSLVSGLYAEETMERLPVLDDAGQPVDDKVHIADLEIVDTP